MTASTHRVGLLICAAVCSQLACTSESIEHDATLQRARALQAMVCVQLGRAPAGWRSDLQLSGPGSNETWQVLSEQPLLDHNQKVSAVYRRGAGQLFLVVQGGLPETIAVYGPLSAAPQCHGGA